MSASGRTQAGVEGPAGSARPAAESVSTLVGRRAAAVFFAFAFAYFFSALLRAVTATLAPEFSRELGLGAGQLGLLAGAYFLGFSAMQLPLGQALDRHGPKRVIIGLLLVAVAGCVAFSLARSMVQMLLARLVIGLGVSACLMAPLTLYRHRFSAPAQMRANSWMLMTGSLGMLMSTVPAQWLLPMLGWRGLFALAAALLLLSVLLILVLVPRDRPSLAPAAPDADGYRAVFRTPAFQRLAPAGFFTYGGMVAMQSLWIGPWLTNVGLRTSDQAAAGLFVVNACMLVAFMGWGFALPRLLRGGWHAQRIISLAWWPGALCLLYIVWRGAAAGASDWALWCVLTSVITLSQPAVAQAFPAALAGRALSAFNLVIFLGVFVVQWGLGLLIDALIASGLRTEDAYRASFALYLACCVAAFLWMHGRSAAVPARP